LGLAAYDTLRPVHVRAERWIFSVAGTPHTNRSEKALTQTGTQGNSNLGIKITLNTIKAAEFMRILRHDIDRQQLCVMVRLEGVCVMVRLAATSPHEQTCPDQHSGNRGWCGHTTAQE
jgi:hypothetical protein